MISARAALLYGPGQDYKIDTIELDEPGPGEVLVEMRACGMCHSDEHVRTGDLPLPHYPVINGHEGAGEVSQVGDGVTSVAVGDHVAMAFIPSCGSCASCLVGQAFLCDLGMKLFDTGIMTDGRVAHRIGNEPVARFSQLGAFAERQLLPESQSSRWLRTSPGPRSRWSPAASPPDSARRSTARESVPVTPSLSWASVGSASARSRARGWRERAGSSPLTRWSSSEQALRFGATHVYPSLDDAIAEVGALTWGQMCDSVICTFGVMRGDLLEPASTLTAKGGTCVVTSVAPIAQAQADVNLFMLAMMNKEIKGCLYGSESPRTQIPRLLNLYRDGILKLDELITETYSLDQVNQGYADIEAGRVLRGVIIF